MDWEGNEVLIIYNILRVVGGILLLKYWPINSENLFINKIKKYGNLYGKFWYL